MRNILMDTRASYGMAAANSGTSTLTGAAVDCDGCSSAAFVVQLGTADAGNRLQIEASTNGQDGWYAIPGAVAAGASKLQVEVAHLLTRYLRPVITRGVATTASQVLVLTQPRHVVEPEPGAVIAAHQHAAEDPLTN